MNLIEVLISSLLLAGSSAAALGVWGQAATEVGRSSALEQQAEQLERLRLASHRWLIAEAGAQRFTNGSCQFEVGTLTAAMNQAIPAPEGVDRRLSADSSGAGIWQELEATSAQSSELLQRRQLITPAAYGLCQP